jgi:hypothetical protein
MANPAGVPWNPTHLPSNSSARIGARMVCVKTCIRTPSPLRHSEPSMPANTDPGTIHDHRETHPARWALSRWVPCVSRTTSRLRRCWFVTGELAELTHRAGRRSFRWILKVLDAKLIGSGLPARIAGSASDRVPGAGKGHRSSRGSAPRNVAGRSGERSPGFVTGQARHPKRARFRGL